MTFTEIAQLLQARFILETNTTNAQPYLIVGKGDLLAIGEVLRDDERLFFDQLACITAIDNGPTADTMEVFYNFASIPYEHTLMLRVTIPRQTTAGELPSLPSLSSLWRTADWHEREAFDLVGIRFENHPDLRRILLPSDWEGHPLRTDYVEPEQYHGIVNK
ncbi:MAG: NADH-quinone oxidoreductase subunit C [Cytophagales bacterium]|nr:MAG: NADH-quinone oxidoreductase subunit C [Cytophagales bacterium]